MTAPSILVISAAAPFEATRARDALDLVLTAAAFEIEVALWFRDDAVYQLLADQQAAAIEQKALAANLQVLPLYDVNALYASARALSERGITADQLTLPVTLLDDAAAAELLQRYDQIVSF